MEVTLMSRVAVFGKMGGTERIESTRAKLGYLDEKKEEGTNSISTQVWRNDSGKVYVDFRTDDFTSGHTTQVEVRVMGVKLQDLMDAYEKQGGT